MIRVKITVRDFGLGKVVAVRITVTYLELRYFY